MKQDKKLADFLRVLPEGTILYSPLLGEVKKVKTTDSGIFVKKAFDKENDAPYLFRYNGCLSNYEKGEPMLFSSCQNRSWKMVDFEKGDIVAMDHFFKDGNKKTCVAKFKRINVSSATVSLHSYIKVIFDSVMYDVDNDVESTDSCYGSIRIVFRFATVEEKDKFEDFLKRKKSMDAKSVTQQFKDCCNKLAELVNQRLFDGCRTWYWICDDVDGTCDFEDADIINAEDMVRILENDMDYDEYSEWRDANIDNNRYINLKSWLMGARHDMFKEKESE